MLLVKVGLLKLHGLSEVGGAAIQSLNPSALEELVQLLSPYFLAETKSLLSHAHISFATYNYYI